MASQQEGSQHERAVTAVSPALALAQERLLRLRQALDATQLSQGFALVSGDHGRFPPPSPLQQPSLVDQVNQLPPHLGWESAPVTAVLRQSERDAYCVMRDVRSQEVTHHASRITQPTERESFVKVYPSVAQGILREGQAAAGRVWLLLRYLDENGRGWVTESEAQAHFTTKPASRLTHHASRITLPYIFGKRQWRNMLRKGTDIFWQRENGRLWLNSVSKTAAALGVWQLNGRPVQLPVTVLTQKIGTVRAHFYATFHSSRAVARPGKQSQPKPKPKPIARETLAAQFNITPHTQRRYERKARVQTHKNYAIGSKETTENAENGAWRHGAAAFSLTDYLGKHGRPGVTYLAWQLPNHYVGPHQQACRGQQKRINRELADLFMKGMTGNDEGMVDNISRRFCGNGRLAANVYNRNEAQQDVYWRGAGNGIWHVMERDS